MRALTGNLGHARMLRQQGFTLIEVMIVVVIVAVLLAVALPAYQSSLQKGRRADGRALLVEISNRQEQFMLDRNTYSTNILTIGGQTTSDEGYYTASVAACATGTIARCYVITAAPVAGGAQAGDPCGSLILDSTGNKSVSGTDNGSCW